MSTTARLLVGVDKGTSVTKAAVFDEHGTQLSWASRRIRALHRQPGWHEEDPHDSWARTAEAIREAVEALPEGHGQIVAVSVTAHMGGAWLIDEAGEPVRDAISWPDARATPAVVALENGPDHEEYLDLSGVAALPGMQLTLLAWLAEHEPEALDRATTVLFAKDYVQFRLCGTRGTDPSDASFGPVDIATGRYSLRLLEILGAEAAAPLLPEVRGFGEIVGAVTATAAAETGLPEGVPVVNGMGDAVAAMFGCGATLPGEAVSVLGTSWLTSTVVDRPVMEPRGIGWLYAMPGGTWVHVLANTSGASTLDWWLGHLFGEQAGQGVVDFAALEREVLSSPEAGGAVTFLPYLSAAGVQAPFKDENVRGVMLGMSEATTRADLLRAVYDGLVYAATDSYDAHGHRPHLVKVTGGGSRSAIWPGTLANALGVPAELLESTESAALGVCVQAGVSVGLWPDVPTAVKALVHVTEHLDPDPALTEAHARALTRYRAAQDMARAFFAPS